MRWIDTRETNGMRLWKTSRFALALIGATLAGSASAADLKSVHDLMAEDLEPAAEVIWDSAGWITTVAGEQSLWPTTDAGWATVAQQEAQGETQVLQHRGHVRRSRWTPRESSRRRLRRQFDRRADERFARHSE